MCMYAAENMDTVDINMENNQRIKHKHSRIIFSPLEDIIVPIVIFHSSQ